jgi:hypothetical protein
MTTPGCCDELDHPRIIVNPPGLDSVDYRVGTYAEFRHALLRPRPNERALAAWNPAPRGDLAVQLLEWWAYLSDILTFYNERAVQEVLLRTAALPEDVRRIVRLLGYRPRPGIGASGAVAVVSSATLPFIVPVGFPIQGQVEPGAAAQIFEVDEDIDVGELRTELPPSAGFPPPRLTNARKWRGKAPRTPNGKLVDRVAAGFKTDESIQMLPGKEIELALDGVVSSIQPDDIVVAIPRDWTGHLDPDGYAIVSVRDVKFVFDPAGKALTVLKLLCGSAFHVPNPKDFRFLKATKTAHLWLYHERYPGSTNPMLLGVSTGLQIVQRIFDPLGLFAGGSPPTRPPEDPRVITGMQMMAPPRGIARLEAVVRGINPGDPVLFEKRTGGGLAALFDLIAKGVPESVLGMLRMLVAQLVQVTGYAEDIWYANAPQMDRIGQGPPIGPPSHSVLGGMQGAEGAIPMPHTRISFDPNPILDLMAVGDLDLNKILVHYDWQEIGEIVPGQKVPEGKIEVPAVEGLPDDVQVPALVRGEKGGSRAWLNSRDLVPDEPLSGKLEAFMHLLPVSRGQSVRGEVLGSGDPTLAGQELVLKQSPLTYLTDTGPRSTNGYRSTLRIRVDGIEWREVPSFYGQPADARVFVTREDEEQVTHVRFGDGENGARLPAGRENVVADYRVGSGAALPRPGTLTTILQPRPGVDAIVNPVPVGGGADPDPPEHIRRYAPRSVMTFGRAISGDDYETLAAQTPGVSRARVYWAWDAAHQRKVVKVFVGDDAPAVEAARKALLAFADPNRPVVVAPATPIYPELSLCVVVDPAYDPDAVGAAVTRALLDPRAQPFGSEVVRIGQIVYDSQIHDACVRVPGVVAVHRLELGLWPPLQPMSFLTSFAYLPLDFGENKPFGNVDLDRYFGSNFLVSELFAPEKLQERRGILEKDLFDPFLLASKIVEPTPPPVPEPPAPLVPDLQPGPRYVPPEGKFFLLRASGLHVTTEVARHAL